MSGLLGSESWGRSLAKFHSCRCSASGGGGGGGSFGLVPETSIFSESAELVLFCSPPEHPGNAPRMSQWENRSSAEQAESCCQRHLVTTGLSLSRLCHQQIFVHWRQAHGFVNRQLCQSVQLSKKFQLNVSNVSNVSECSLQMSPFNF